MQTNNIIQCQGLIADDLPFDYKGDALDFELSAGEVVSIIGPNDTGKSQWLRTLCGLESQRSGDLHLLGINALEISATDWANTRMKVAYVHTNTALLSAANGFINTMIPALYHRLDNLPEKDLLAERAFDLLEEIDPHLNLDDLPAYISKEQQYKIAVARALLLEPDVLALDAPFISFSNETKREFQRFLNKRVENGLSLLLVTNDIPYALNHSDKILFTETENLHQFDGKQDILNSKNPIVNEYITLNS